MANSGIDVVIEVYKMLNVPALRNALGQGKLWQHNIPQNSPYTEVVISIPTTDAYESELRFFDVDIRTPNLDNFYPHQTLPQDNTFPDMAEFKRITDIILPLIQTRGTLYVETKVPGVPVRDADGTWRVNIRVEFTLLDTQDTHSASLVALTGVKDGFGGYVPTPSTVWSGTARRVSVIDSPHADKTAGIYGLYLRCSWLIAMDGAPEPRKNMKLVSDDGEYVITGIIPDGIFWRLTTTRKDGAYA